MILEKLELVIRNPALNYDGRAVVLDHQGETTLRDERAFGTYLLILL